MKRYVQANRILAGAMALFLVALGMTMWSPWRESSWLSILYFLAQSCFIGCMADFIAVEALFRKRFHLPYRPLIPHNRKRIIRRMKDINNTLLSSENLLKMIEGWSISSAMQNYLAGNEGAMEEWKRKLAREAARWLADFAMDWKGEMGGYLRKEGKHRLASFLPYAKERLLNEMQREEIMDGLLEKAAEKAGSWGTVRLLVAYMEKMGEEKKKGFLQSVLYGAGRAVGMIDYDDLAWSATETMEEELRSWKDRENPFRRTLIHEWDTMVHAFLDEEATEKGLRDFGKALFDAVPWEEKTEEAMTALLSQWCEGEAFEHRLVPKVESVIRQGFTQMEKNEDFREKLDAFARDFLKETVVYGHVFWTDRALEVMKRFSDEELNEFVESKVHGELEGIRVNGAIVGLFGGCAFYLFLLFVWIPMIQAMMKCG